MFLSSPLCLAPDRGFGNDRRMTQPSSASSLDRSAREIFRGAHYLARFLSADAEALVPDGPVVVFFETWLPQPDMEAPVTGETFFTHRGLDVIAIKPAANDWYQQDEMTELIDAVLAETKGRRRVGYGGSMGGYAAINFAESLALDDLVAVAPQFSIDPALMPQDWRWRREAEGIAFRQDRMRLIGRLQRGTIIYDPDSEDRPHVRAILMYHDLTPLPLRFCGHHMFRALQQARVLPMLAMNLVLGRFDRAAFRRAFRQGRRKSPVFWLELARGLCTKCWLKAATAALDRARGLAPDDAFAQDVVAGEIARAGGNHQEADRLMQLWRSHENAELAEAARYRMAQWAWYDTRSAEEIEYERAARAAEHLLAASQAIPDFTWPVSHGQ
ncbi:putative cytosolic protein [Granulibacter bethesdensis CGDNIH4]|nr:putative cytosolic protein [Granulibacter bethesdensis CGDNIH4]